MDRFSLPEDRRDDCHACGSEKREYLTICARCETDICSECLVPMRFDDLGVIDLCDYCAAKYRNERAVYGHQLEIAGAA